MGKKKAFDLLADEWCIAFCISMAACTLLFTLARIIKVKFSRSRTKNSLTLKPLYLASVLLVLYIADAAL
jgi:hypothetical protein